jgi:hypothetical protein
MSGQLHECEEMDDFFSLYLAVNAHKAFDYGFGCKDKTPLAGPRAQTITKQHHYDFPFAFTFSRSSR